MKLLNTLTTVAVSAVISQTAIASNTEELRATVPQANVELIDPVFVNPTLFEPDVIVLEARNHYFKRALTSTKPQTTSSEKFIPVPGARTRLKLGPGEEALVNVAFTAESRCNEADSNAQNWCEVSILVNGAEASPAASSFAPDTFAFDSTDRGTETSASWEAHAMDRHRCVKNTSDVAIPITVETMWKVTNFDGNNAPNFWLDDWSLTVELARGCRQTYEKFPSNFEAVDSFKTLK